MVRWGGLEIPELDQISLIPGTPAPVAGHHLLSEGTILHRPTGLRLIAYQSDYNDRGMWREFYLTPPPGEDWRIEVDVAVGPPSIRTRVQNHLDLTADDPVPRQTVDELVGRMLVAEGERYECFTAAPAHGAPAAHWSVPRRDALVLMLFWAMEQGSLYNRPRLPPGPYPSTLVFRPHGVPGNLHGTFRNPLWERLHASQ